MCVAHVTSDGDYGSKLGVIDSCSEANRCSRPDHKRRVGEQPMDAELFRQNAASFSKRARRSLSTGPGRWNCSRA
jgi:hypothetical protein